MDEWVLPPGEKLEATLEFPLEDTLEFPLEGTLEFPRETLEIKVEKASFWPWRRSREAQLQANLEKLRQEYEEGKLFWGTELRRDAFEESYARFPPKLKAKGWEGLVRFERVREEEFVLAFLQGRILLGLNGERALRFGFHREKTFWAVGAWPLLIGIKRNVWRRKEILSEEYDLWTNPEICLDPCCIIDGQGDPLPGEGGAIPDDPDEDGHIEGYPI